MSKQTITEFLLNPQSGSIDENGDIDCGVWYDWFCKDSALVRKGANLTAKLNSIAKSNKFDNDKCYVFFKNNCPMHGPLYDSFSICDIETGDVLFYVTPKCGHTGLATVCSREKDYEVVVKGNWKDVKNYFLEK